MQRHSHRSKGIPKHYDEIMEFLEMMKRVKLHLYPGIAKDSKKVFVNNPKPTKLEIDEFTSKFNSLLSSE